MTRVNNADPASVTADYWLVEYYRRNATVGAGQPWGADTGDSAASVMTQMAKDQEFEKKWERWCGCSWGDDTFFNPRGPIAVMHASEEKKGALQTILPVAERIKGLIETFKTVSDIFSEKPGENNPSADVGNVSKEYIDNLKDAIHLQTQLQRILTSAAGGGTLSTSSLQDISSKLDKCDQDLPKLQQAVASNAPSPNITFSGTSHFINPWFKDTGQITLRGDSILVVTTYTVVGGVVTN